MTQVVLAVALGALATIGTFLLLRRDVVRVVWGVVILGQTANVYLVTMGGLAGTAPILEHGGETAEQEEGADGGQGAERHREDDLGHSRPTTLRIVRRAPTTTRYTPRSNTRALASSTSWYSGTPSTNTTACERKG